jgi:hypothetical protein
VSTTGSNNDTGQFPNHCWADLLQAKSTMAAGDITYALNGVTQTSIDNYSSSFSISVGGAQGAPLAVVAYPGAAVTIGDNSIELGTRTPNISGAFDHWVLAGLTLRGKSALSVGWTDFRIVGNDISCDGSSQWGCVQPYGDSQKYLGNDIHDSGQNCGVNPNTCKLYHAVYFGVTNHVEFAWNDVNPDPNRTGVAGCRAVQFHTTDNSGLDDSDVHVHDNVIRNAICDGMNLVTVDPDMGTVEVYNNVVYHVGTGPAPAGVESNYACLYTNSNHTPTAAVEVFNNTFYDCGSRGNSSSGAFTSDINTRMRNNIVVAVGSSEPYLAGSGTGCSVVSGGNNLFIGAGAAPSCPNLSGSMAMDPMFLSSSSFDFHLQQQSPARNAGMTIAALAVDLDGVPRPQGNAFALGAYEFNTGYVPPPPVDAGRPASDAGTGADGGGGPGPGGHDGGGGGTPPDGGPGPGGLARSGCGCQGGSGAASFAALLGCLALALGRTVRRQRESTRED